jgi:hypothetical protein
MFYRIPREIFRSLKTPAETVVLDPFCGSGTVLLEGLLLGYNTLGIDVNPLARLISNVKTNVIDPTHLKRHLAGVLRRATVDRYVLKSSGPLTFWFKPTVLGALHRIRRSIEVISHPECRDFYLATFSSIVRSCSLADPSIAPPVRLSSLRAVRGNDRYRRDLRHSQLLSRNDVVDSFVRAADRNIARMEALYNTTNRGTARVLSATREAAATGLKDASIDMIVTSPPYCGAQKYVRSLRLEMLLLNMEHKLISEVDRNTLGTERVSKVRMGERLKTGSAEANRLINRVNLSNSVRALMLAEYVRYLTRFSRECWRVLRPGGHAFVTFGTSRIAGHTVDLAKLFMLEAVRAGFKPLATLIDRIPSRGLLTARHVSAGIINDERVVWVQK